VPTPDEVVEDYIALWNASEPEERRRLAERALAEDATVAYPSVEARGRDEIVAAIGNVHQRVPGVRFVSTSGVEQHHGWLRATWRMMQGDGEVLFDGVDSAETGEDGRLRRVIGFHDPPPAS
jgi:hypothetical protein